MEGLTAQQRQATRISAYSLSNDQYTPEWLVDTTLSFEEAMRPPSYWIASLQQALDDEGLLHNPPAYDAPAATDPQAGPSTPRMRPLPRPPLPKTPVEVVRVQKEAVFPLEQKDDRESIWEDSDDEDDDEFETVEEGGDGDASESNEDADDADDERERGSDGESTLLDVPLAPLAGRTAPLSPRDLQQDRNQHQPSPRPPSQDHHTECSLPRIRPHILPPALHLLHLQHITPNHLKSSVASTKTSMSDMDPYTDLAALLAALDAQLLLSPFAAFEDLCYETAVRGDPEPSNPRLYAAPQPRESPAPQARRRTPTPPSSATPDKTQEEIALSSQQEPYQRTQNRHYSYHSPSGSTSTSSSGSSTSDSLPVAPTSPRERIPRSSRALALALNNEQVDNIIFASRYAHDDNYSDHDHEFGSDLDEDDDEEDDEDELPRSPAPTFVPSPLVYDGRSDDRPRHRHDLSIVDGVRCLSPVSMSLLLSHAEAASDADVNPAIENEFNQPYRSKRVGYIDPAAEVACLFLHTPVAASAGAAVQKFPTRPPPEQAKTGNGGRVRGLMRSLTFTRGLQSPTR